MRFGVVSVAAVLLSTASVVRAEDPRAVIERAFKATGLDPDPTRRPAIVMTVRFSGWWEGTGRFSYQPPRRRRWDLALQGQPKLDEPPKSLTIVLDGDQGWVDYGGNVRAGP